MIIQGILANTGVKSSNDELLEYLIEHLPDTTFYQFRPPPGEIMAAGINWRGVIHDAAALITIGGVLWGAYTKFIEPILEEEAVPSPAMIVIVEDQQGKSSQFILGKEYKDKDVFIQQLRSKTKLVESSQSGNKIKTKIEEFESSSYWIKVQK